VITVLADHNLEGQADLLKSVLASAGWIELAVLRIVTFAELSLPFETPDRKERGMVLLTANRNKDGADSLEQAILELNQPASYPVVTIANLDRLLETDYRVRCATKLAEVCMEIERFLGTGRIYIP